MYFLHNLDEIKEAVIPDKIIAIRRTEYCIPFPSKTFIDIYGKPILKIGLKAKFMKIIIIKILNINFSFLMQVMPSLKSEKNIFKFNLSFFRLFLGMFIKISLIADNIKLIEFIINITPIPKLSYKIAPRANANIFERLENNVSIEFASTNDSFSTIEGITV